MKTFPKPLTPGEEKQYLERCLKGDLEARNILIERNMRLVAHVAKNTRIRIMIWKTCFLWELLD